MLALHGEGLTAPAIADRTGTTEGTVRVVLCRDGRLPRRPVTSDPTGLRRNIVTLNDDVIRELRPVARRFGTTVNQVARELVEAALDRGLIDQLLEGRF